MRKKSYFASSCSFLLTYVSRLLDNLKIFYLALMFLFFSVHYLFGFSFNNFSRLFCKLKAEVKTYVYIVISFYIASIFATSRNNCSLEDNSTFFAQSSSIVCFFTTFYNVYHSFWITC